MNEAGTQDTLGTPNLPEIKENLSQKAAYELLRSEGFDHEAACKVLNIKDSYAVKLKSQAREVRKLGLVSERNVRTAHSAILRTARGTKVGSAKAPNASDVLAAAREILDRAEPKKTHSVQEHRVFRFVEVDMGQFRMGPDKDWKRTVDGNADGNRAAIEAGK